MRGKQEERGNSWGEKKRARKHLTFKRINDHQELDVILKKKTQNQKKRKLVMDQDRKKKGQSLPLLTKEIRKW